MHLPRSPLISDAHLYISGHVTIDHTAAIAPGVLLQADPGSHLIIAAGVSIGGGCVLHAHQGTLELEPGVTLGSGVLMMGCGKIGTNSCIGSMSTLIDSTIAPGYTVPPGTLMGDRSRQEGADPPVVPSSPPVTPTATSTQAPESPAAPSATSSDSNGKSPVYGQVYLERMMVMMFPHRQKIENPSSDD